MSADDLYTNHNEKRYMHTVECVYYNRLIES
jgi:hypothetical protein